MGNCYELAYKKLSSLNHERWVLAHGNPILRVAPFVRFGHAWVESEDCAFDVSTGRIIDIELYYGMGHITEVQRYTLLEADRMVFQHGTFGPWHPEFANLLFAE